MDTIKNLIRTGNLAQALEALASISSEYDQTEIILLQSRLSNLTQNETRGTIGTADANIERAKLNMAALDLCGRVTPVPGKSLPDFLAKNVTSLSDHVKQNVTPLSDHLAQSTLSQSNHSSTQMTPTEPPKGKKIFISYSKKDLEYLEELNTHLSPLKRKGKITAWYDREILAGEEWDENIMNELKTADIILLLISADFINTEYIWEKEITLAMERHEKKEARVIPIIIRNCQWDNMPFSKLNGLPAKGKPVKSYDDRDEAWLEIVKGIERVLNVS